MPKRLAVVTTCVGSLYERISELSHPTIKAYAEKLGAEFIVFRDVGQHKNAGWKKLDLKDLLAFRGRGGFERILYVDSDILIRHDAPNIFEVVPEDRVGMLNEGAVVDRRQAKHNWNPLQSLWWTTDTYYNTGVICCSAAHRELFFAPAEEIDNFYEQTHLNYNVWRFKVPVFELPYRFNRLLMFSKLTGEARLDSFFLHYAGQFSCGEKSIMDMTIQTMKDDLAAWARGGWHPKEDLSGYV